MPALEDTEGVTGSIGGATAAALCAAMAYGTGAVLQHQAARRTGRGDTPDIRALTSLLRARRWLVGTLCHVLGLALHVVALGLGPVALVQPLQVSSLLWALPAEGLARRERPRGRQISAALLVVLGILVFALLARPGASTRSLDVATGLELIGVTLAVLTAGGLAARRLSSGPRAVIWGGLSGAGYAVTAVLINSVTAPSVAHRLPALALVGATLVVGSVAVLLTQAAYQTAHLSAALPAVTVVNPVVAVLLGAGLLGEDLTLQVPTVLGMVLSVMCVTAGVVQLARPPERSERPPRSWRSGLSAVSTLGAGAGAVLVVALDAAWDPDDDTLTRALLGTVVLACGLLVGPLVEGVRTLAGRREPPDPPPGDP